MEAILEYIVSETDSGKTVEKILKKQFGISSKLMIYLKLNGKLRLNGKICRSVDCAKYGDLITADVSENLDGFGEILPFKIDIEVVYEDEYIMVINKQSNLEVHPSIGNHDSTLANAVVYYWAQKGEYHNFHIVNRLDKDTSGLCVIAKNKFAHSVISNQIKEKIFKRKYFAIVHGIFDEKTGTIEKPIKRECESLIKRVIAEDGQYAKTKYCVIKSVDNKYSLLDIELETGRTHQIRVHFSSIGHPLLGDWLYGFGDAEKHLIKRQALHAGQISFSHPKTGKIMEFKAKLPIDMQNIVKEHHKL